MISLDDIGDQLCERVLGVLFEIWLIACVKSFPSPTLWKTFREMCMNWRHRTGNQSINQLLFFSPNIVVKNLWTRHFMKPSQLLPHSGLGLVTQWNRVNLALTSRLLSFLYGPKFPILNIQKVTKTFAKGSVVIVTMTII